MRIVRDEAKNQGGLPRAKVQVDEFKGRLGADTFTDTYGPRSLMTAPRAQAEPRASDAPGAASGSRENGNSSRRCEALDFDAGVSPEVAACFDLEMPVKQSTSAESSFAFRIGILNTFLYKR